MEPPYWPSVLMLMIRLAFPLFLVVLLGSIVFGSWSYAEEAPSEGSTPEAASKLEKPKITEKQKEALEHYNKGVRLFRAAQLEKSKGEAFNHRRLLRESEGEFKAALRDNDELVPARSNLGFVFLAKEDSRRAIREFERALELNPKHTVSLNGLATAYSMDDAPDKALETYERLLQLTPGDPQAWFNKGSVLQKFKRLEAAETAYTKALNLDPLHQPSLFNLATLYENSGRALMARRYYEKAKGVAIDSPIGLQALRRLEILDAAEKSIEK